MITEVNTARRELRAEQPPAALEPPPVQLLQMMNGYWITQSIAVAAELGLADHLADGPATAEDLAGATSTDAQSLRRLLRALAMIGVLEEHADGTFGLSPIGTFLRGDVPGSLRALARMRGSEWQWRSWRELGHSIRTGETALDHVYGKPLFEYFADSPADGAVFNEAMTSHASQMHTAVAAAYDFPARAPSWTSARGTAPWSPRSSRPAPASARSCSICRASSTARGSGSVSAASATGVSSWRATSSKRSRRVATCTRSRT